MRVDLWFYNVTNCFKISVPLYIVYNLLIRPFKLFTLFILFAASFSAKAQLIVGEADPYILITNVLVGKGLTTNNITYTGHKRACVFFENGMASKLKMDAGIILSTGIAVGAKGPNDAGNKSTSELPSGGSVLLDQYAGGTTYDAAVLQFDFIPQTEDIIFNYIFASEEYPEYVDKNVSDIFGFFISGPGITGEQNVALIPGKTLPVSIDNINHLRNSQFFNLNTLGEKTLQADGFTTVLTAFLKLQPCKTYTIKLAIADVGDRLLDSYVFMEAGSFQHKTNLGRDTFICIENFDIELDAGNPGRRVIWRKNGVILDTTQKIKVNSFGTYEVEIFTDCGSFIAKKKILPGVSDIFIGNDTIYCGDSLSRKLEVKNRVFDSYLWSDNSTDETLTVKKPGMYWLEIDRGGCKKRDSVLISLVPLPKINFGKDTIVCGAVNLILSAQEKALKYVWYYNANQTADTGIRILAVKPGTYSVQSFNTYCNNRDTISIVQRRVLTVDLGPPLREICQNDTISLRTGIRDTLNFATKWNTGAATSTIYTNTSGIYSVTVRDKLCNFTATDSVLVNVYEGVGNIWVPNAFTPGDNDALNATFKPVSDIGKYNYYQFLIFDRWGQKLFDSTDPNAAWEGTFENKACENGVYIWSLNVKSNCSKGDNNFQKGIVHLIR